MFSGMGMFGAFGFDSEEETKKNEEMKREAELRKKYEENLDKPITITQRQLMEAQAHVMAKGKFMSIASRTGGAKVGGDPYYLSEDNLQ